MACGGSRPGLCSQPARAGMRNQAGSTHGVLPTPEAKPPTTPKTKLWAMRRDGLQLGAQAASSWQPPLWTPLLKARVRSRTETKICLVFARPMARPLPGPFPPPGHKLHPPQPLLQHVLAQKVVRLRRTVAASTPGKELGNGGEHGLEEGRGRQGGLPTGWRLGALGTMFDRR